jgi:hypothetical protein
LHDVLVPPNKFGGLQNKAEGPKTWTLLDTVPKNVNSDQSNPGRPLPGCQTHFAESLSLLQLVFYSTCPQAVNVEIVLSSKDSLYYQATRSVNLVGPGEQNREKRNRDCLTGI